MLWGQQAGQGAKYVKANRKGRFTYLQANYTTQQVKEKAKVTQLCYTILLHNLLHNILHKKLHNARKGRKDKP